VPPTAILALGHALPPRLVTNEELARRCGVEVAALGGAGVVSQRHYAAPGVAPSDLALDATRVALARAGCAADDLDFLVFATMTPDVAFPGSGCYLQAKLGVSPIGALDIRAQCLGFLFGLVVADRLLGTGAYRRILVAGSEVHSTSLDFSPGGAAVTPYFGDGAGVAIVGRGERGGLRASVLHTDASALEDFWCEFPASRQYPKRMTIDDLRERRHYLQIRFDALDPRARRCFRDVIGEVLERGGCRDADVAHYFLHYVDPRVPMETATAMGIGPDRVTVAGQRAGHIAAAALPIALSQAHGAGAVRRGDLVCLAAVGAGLNWGAALVEL
jgi:3-oxoacyl-[acyl-carrier-protein] synthase-3